jgi:hypothetical protein
MSDQTRPEWQGQSLLGVLVIFSDIGLTNYLGSLVQSFSSQVFRWPENPDFVKIYLKHIQEQQVRSFDLGQFEFSWIPDTIKDILYGRCRGEDCRASQRCAMPGCLCHKGKCR